MSRIPSKSRGGRTHLPKLFNETNETDHLKKTSANSIKKNEKHARSITWAIYKVSLHKNSSNLMLTPNIFPDISVI